MVSKREPPSPEDFGLDRELTLSEASQELERIKKRYSFIVKSIVWVWIILISLIIILLTNSENKFYFVWFTFLISWIIFHVFIENGVIKNFVDRKAGDLLRFVQEYREWSDKNSESGRSYWQNKRGVDFEIAVAAFFRRRGWNADLTPASGDGGIDVILSRGNQIYWCQCKGHAKAISISEVRRVAGATLKSKGLASPILISSNGFTLPALREAKILGVTCIESSWLTKKSELDDISDIAHF